MNKGITILILLVVLGAMGLVMYTHTSGKQKVPPVLATGNASGTAQGSGPGQNGLASPLRGPQGDNGSLRPIEPPVSGAQPSEGPQASSGTPKPVALTAGADGKPAQPAGAPSVQPPAPPVDKPAATAQPAEPAPSAPAASAGTQPAPSGQDAAKPAGAAPASPEKPSSGSPGLTPWASPPQQTQAAGSAAAQNTKPATAPATKPGTPATAQPTPALSDKAAHTLKNISIVFAGENMLLRIEADSAFPCKTFALTGPDRLVIDLPGAWSGMKSPSVPKNRVVKSVRLGQQPAGPRLVLDLNGPLKAHRVLRSGSMIEVLVN